MGCMYSTGMYIFYRYSKMASSLRSKHVGVCCKTLYILDSVHLMTSCWYTNLWTSRAWLWEAFFPPKGAPHTVDRPLASPIYHGVCSKTEPAPGPLDWAWTGKAVVFCATWNPRAEKHHSPLSAACYVFLGRVVNHSIPTCWILMRENLQFWQTFSVLSTLSLHVDIGRVDVALRLLNQGRLVDGGADSKIRDPFDNKDSVTLQSSVLFLLVCFYTHPRSHSNRVYKM